MNNKTIRGFGNTGLIMAGMMTGGSMLMTGCSSLPAKTSLSPQQAVIGGYQQLYSTPNYQFEGQFKINQLAFNRDPKVLQAAAELQQQKKAKQKQQLIQRYIDELSAAAEAKAKAYAEADARANSSADPYALSANERESIRQQAEQAASEYDDATDDFATDDPETEAPEQRNSKNKLGHLGSMKTDKLINDLLYTYAKRYQFNYKGTVDLRHGQIALSPEMRYEARNMAGYVQVPLVLDLRHAHLYADLSALSPWLVQVQNDGKYSRFDLSAYKDKVDAKQLLEVLKQITQASYQLPKAQQFQEVGLSAQERQQGAVRKVEFSQPLAHRMADVATFLSLNQNSLKQIVKSKNAEDKQREDKQNEDKSAKNQRPVELISAEAARQLMAQNPETYQHILQMVEEKIDPVSRLKQVILLDNKGRVVDSSAVYDLIFKPSSKGQLNMQLSHHINFANYGRAEVTFKPNASNWIDAKANMQDTLFGGLMSIFSKKSLGADDMLKSFGDDE
ncbi:MAG: hypothetical protein EOO69_11690 [Moraxellaceae bacterium]|nr:MAG: hypothetical protein EOO69_11690 [Moraxellaceae bacterium]